MLRQVQPIYGMSHLLNEAVVAEARPGDRGCSTWAPAAGSTAFSPRAPEQTCLSSTLTLRSCVPPGTTLVATERATGLNLKR